MERFYGLEIAAGKDVGAEIDPGQVLHVSQIALPGPDGGKSTVFVTVDGKKLCVGTLDGKAHVYHIGVDLLFSAEQQVRFTAVGSSGVHITGYTQEFADADSMGDSLDEDESDGDLEDNDSDVGAKGVVVGTKNGGSGKAMGVAARKASEVSKGVGHLGKCATGSSTKPGVVAVAPHAVESTSNTDGESMEEDMDTDDGDPDEDEDGDSDDEMEQRPGKQRHVERGGPGGSGGGAFRGGGRDHYGGAGRGFNRGGDGGGGHRGRSRGFGGRGDRGGFHRGGDGHRGHRH